MGFTVNFSTAIIVLIAKSGLPVPTTHVAMSGVMGISLARGVEAVNFSIINKIMLYWILCRGIVDPNIGKVEGAGNSILKGDGYADTIF